MGVVCILTLASSGVLQHWSKLDSGNHLTVMYSSKLVLHTQNRVQPGRVADFMSTAGARFGTIAAVWYPKSQNQQKMPKS